MTAEFSNQQHGSPAPEASSGQSSHPTAGAQSFATDREQVRSELPNTPAARLIRSNQPGMFVTLLDISKGGCRVLRKGRMTLRNEETVHLDLWAEQTDVRVSLSAVVCWARDAEEDTQAGLKFSISNPSLLRQLETYIHQIQVVAAEDRPQPVLRQQRTSTSEGSITDRADANALVPPSPARVNALSAPEESDDSAALATSGAGTLTCATRSIASPNSRGFRCRSCKPGCGLRSLMDRARGPGLSILRSGERPTNSSP